MAFIVLLYMVTVLPDTMLKNTTFKGKIFAIGFDFYMYSYSYIIPSLHV